MFQAIISFSLRQRVVVLLAACILVVWGSMVASNMPIDLLPETRAPSVIVTADAGTLASEEVEQLVAEPIESVMNGIPGVTAVRTGSNNGVAFVQVQFAWGTDPFRNRQLVNERLAMVREQMPVGVQPELAPMGTATSLIMILGVTGGESPMKTREYVDWVLRLRLMAIEGVSQVFIVGGEVRTYQFTPSPVLMEHMKITLSDVERTLSAFASTPGGGVTQMGGTEYTIRNMGRTTSLEDLRNLVVATRDGVPVLLGQIGDVSFAPKIKRGDGALNGHPSINLAIIKQPTANTIQVSDRIMALLSELQPAAPQGVNISDVAYSQADMVRDAVSNVGHLLRDAVIIVAGVLFLFLAAVRPTIISLTAIPLSLVITALVFSVVGLTINIITLGGIAMALGELVDDSVVNVENILRRLGLNRKLARPEPAMRVIGRAAQEVLSGILYARAIILIVFVPLLAMPGQPGRMFQPLLLAYVTSVAASLLVSLTVTPALSAYLLPGMKSLEREHGGWFARWLRRRNAGALAWVLDRPKSVLTLAVVAVVVAMSSVPFLPKSFLPQFNEGNVYVTLLARPDLSLNESLRIGHMAEQMLMQLPEVKSVARRSGRLEGDGDVDQVTDTEMVLKVKLDQGRSMKELMAEIRRRLSVFAVDLGVNQFLASRMEAQDTGVQGDIVLKIYGPELPTLRTLAEALQNGVARVKGLADVLVEQQRYAPQARIVVDYARAKLFGVTPAQIIETLSGVSNGRTVAQVVENGRRFDVTIRLSDADRTPDALRRLHIDTPSGAVPLSSFATMTETYGPSRIMRDNGVRRISVMANLDGTESTERVVQSIRDVISREDLPSGYSISLDGDFKLGEQGRAVLGVLGPVAILLIFIVLHQRFRSTVLSLVIMGNIPLALVGSVTAVWMAGMDLNLPVIVGFIAVTGLATRNSLLKVSHFINLHLHEGMEPGRDLVLRGSNERLMPVLMTALAAGSALIPLLFASDVAGAEILHPVAVAVFGGLISSTLLDTFTTPVLFEQFGIKAMDRMIETHAKLAHETF